MATLTWPLYVVGRLATSSGDQTVILQIFSQFLNRHHMKVVDGAGNAAMAHWGEDHSARMDFEVLLPCFLCNLIFFFAWNLVFGDLSCV